ncbi:hypothetical protein [Corynebacterium lowii]|uniref:hypothetical protein n=1 Tax=Corynebacterium lowii TaxID=1544413 RepID=UPI001B800FF7|nr:hypothetical protein [Corynebacterium lowii]MDP9850728.1 hypothetical protein [Corynebacterium lowii]
MVFGTNGSGKSGYGRLISSMVGARHREKIVLDVFTSTSGAPSSEVVFSVGSSEKNDLLGQASDPDRSRIAFYDEYCGDTYLTTETEISYGPSAIKILVDPAAV